MKCLVCNNENILVPISSRKYMFMLYPFSKSFTCCKCDTKYDILLLFGKPKKVKYIVTKFNQKPVLNP